MTNADLEIFWLSGSPYAWRGLLALEVKQLKYTSRLLDASKGEVKAPEYLKLNPRGTVPTLKDGEVIVRESLAIMAYLDRKYPEPSLFGANAQQVAKAWRLISEYLSYAHGPFIRIIEPMYFSRVAEKKSDLLAAVPQVHAELERFQGELADSAWFGGEAVGAADIAIYPFIKSLLRAAAKDEARHLNLGLLPMEECFPHLALWMQRFERVPGYERTYPPHWRL